MPDASRATLRAEQVAQTRAALVTAARHLFGSKGFATTSVEDIVREARVTTGALYHHFSTKTAIFEAVFQQVHADMLVASAHAAGSATDPVEALLAGFGAFLDSVMEPEVQRIVITDAPAVLGMSRYIELDEGPALDSVVAALRAATDSGMLHVADPPTLARLLFGALTRAGLLIASAADPKATRDAVAGTLRAMLARFAMSGD